MGLIDKPFDMFADFLEALLNPYTLIIGILGVIAGIYLYKKYQQRKGEYKERTAEEIVRDNMYDLVDELGDKTRTKLRQNFNVLGVIRKHMKREIGGEQYRILMIHKDGFFPKLAYEMGVKKKQTKILVIPEDALKITDQINIDKSIQFYPVGGVFVTDKKSYKVAEQMAYKAQNEELLITIPEYARKQNFIDSFFAKAVQRDEISHQLDQQGRKAYQEAEAESV